MHKFVYFAWHHFHIDNCTFFKPPTLKVNGNKEKEESGVM